MKIKIAVVGKLKEKYLKQAVSEYSKRLSRFTKLEIIEVSDEKAGEELSAAERMMVMKKEADRLLPKIPGGSIMILLDVEGGMMTSEMFSETISAYTISGKSDFCFVIGGSLGVHSSLIERADLRLSLSKMTFPHQLVRVILLEQLFRAFKIINNETYHK